LDPEGIASGLVGDRTLCIEVEAPAAMYEIEEVQDSEDGTNDGVDGYITCQPFHPNLYCLLILLSYHTTLRSITPRHL
jgi:hypothetical protein